jgi:hypothetical protein
MALSALWTPAESISPNK